MDIETIKKHNNKFDDAAHAGWKAGSNVNISHGVSSTEAAKITGW